MSATGTAVAHAGQHSRILDAALTLVSELGSAGTSMRRQSANDLLAALDGALATWLADGFPELARRGLSPTVVAHLVRRSLLALVTEHLAIGSADVGAHADDVTAVVFPGAGSGARGR